jgi:hypothetical protein
MTIRKTIYEVAAERGIEPWELVGRSFAEVAEMVAERSETTLADADTLDELPEVE